MSSHEITQSSFNFDDMVFEPIPGDEGRRTDYPQEANMGNERFFQVPTEVEDKIAKLALKEVSKDV